MNDLNLVFKIQCYLTSNDLKNFIFKIDFKSSVVDFREQMIEIKI